MREYQLISPSLDGILNHYTVVYEGIKRPVEVLRALDGPARRESHQPYTDKERQILEEYFHDIQGIFMKKFSTFVLETHVDPDEVLRIQALLQELIKVKKLIIRGSEIN